MTPREVIKQVVERMVVKPTLMYTTYLGYNLETLQGLTYPALLIMSPFSWRFVNIDGLVKKKYNLQILFAHQQSEFVESQAFRELELHQMLENFFSTLSESSCLSNGLMVVFDKVEDIGEIVPKEAENIDDTFGFYAEINIAI